MASVLSLTSSFVLIRCQLHSGIGRFLDTCSSDDCSVWVLHRFGILADNAHLEGMPFIIQYLIPELLQAGKYWGWPIKDGVVNMYQRTSFKFLGYIIQVHLTLQSELFYRSRPATSSPA